MKYLTKSTKQQIAKHTAAPTAMPTLKQVMVLDTHDGAFIDASVKVKPHKTDARILVLKCTDSDRLLAAAKRMGLSLAGLPVKGRKHYILFVWKEGFGAALSAGVQAGVLVPKTMQPVPMAHAHKTLVAKGGAK